MLKLNGTKLVDNAWAAPGASGCGGFLAELLLNPIVNASPGLPAAAGKKHGPRHEAGMSSSRAPGRSRRS